MGLFFNNKEEVKEERNKYLEDQKALFDTEGEKKETVADNSYDEFVYKPKDYSNVPKYKASTSKKVDIVVDKDDFGFGDLHPDISTVDLQKNDLHEDLHEIVTNRPIDESTKENHTSIYDEGLSEQIKVDEPVEIIEVDDNKEMVIADVVEENLEKGKKLSIFGNTDEPIQAKVYEVKETPKQEKIEVIEVDITEEKEAVEETVKLNEDGKKVCPQCGAPLKPDAPVCFLCGNKF